MAILLKRNAKVFVSLVESSWTAGNTVRLNVLDDFSYSQSVNASSAARSTIGPTGDRGLISYVQETNPAEFSFTTYFSTFSGSLSDELLWKGLTNKSDVSTTIDFSESDVAVLPELFFYFEHGSKTYKLSNSVITGANISMNLAGIPTINWRGLAKNLVSDTTPTTFLNEHGLIPEAIGKLTTVAVERDSVSYNLALTAFNLDIDNEVEWVPRVRLGQQTLPDTYSTGSRNIGGTMKFYLKTGTDASADLFDAISGDNNTGEPEKFSDVQVSIGNKILVDMPKTLLINTSTNIEEAITLDVPYIANQTSAGAGDEVTITVI